MQSSIEGSSLISAYDNAEVLISSSFGPFVFSWEENFTDNQFVFYTEQSELSTEESWNNPLLDFKIWYQRIHGYLSVVICSFGIISNMMNFLVLTRRNMLSSTNVLLTALAVADLLTMISYLPYAVYFYCVTTPDGDYLHERGWIVYILFSNNFLITWHTIAMWLTVSLAVFRYIVVCHHSLAHRLCTVTRAKITIAAVFSTTVLFCVPNYVMHSAGRQENGGWWFAENSFVTSFHQVINYWLFGVVLKVAPCVLLTVLSHLLIKAMRQADAKRKQLRSSGATLRHLANTSAATAVPSRQSERTSEHNRTTSMLIAVVLCFVVTELPQGVLAFLSGVDRRVFDNIYTPLGDFWDIIVLTNSATNFALYCIMSTRFRRTFCSLFLGRLMNTKFTLSGEPSAQYSTVTTFATKL